MAVPSASAPKPLFTDSKIGTPQVWEGLVDLLIDQVSSRVVKSLVGEVVLALVGRRCFNMLTNLAPSCRCLTDGLEKSEKMDSAMPELGERGGRD